MTDTPEDAIPDPDDSDMPGGTVDVLLIGGGIMSATLGTLLQELQPATSNDPETLSLLEERSYRWGCGCSQERMLSVLAPIMRTNPAGLFGEEDVIRISCPRCGALHTVTRESLEAFVGQKQ